MAGFTPMPVNNEDPYSSGLLNYDPAEFINSFKSPIVNMLTQAYNAINQPTPTPSAIVFEVLLTWNVSDDIDLYVWEPDGQYVS